VCCFVAAALTASQTQPACLPSAHVSKQKQTGRQVLANLAIIITGEESVAFNVSPLGSLTR
jgi:hypothetical protein